MTDAAIISGSLVDAKNVNTHKVMRLIIDVPAENALKVIAAFGWPTMVNPVHVAVARLGSSSAVEQRTPNPPVAGSIPASPAKPSRPDQSVGVPAGADKVRRKFEDLTPAQQAGILCGQQSFRVFLNERFHYNTSSAEEAAEAVRELCKVSSRALLTTDNTEWKGLQLAFRLWEREAEVVPA